MTLIFSKPGIKIHPHHTPVIPTGAWSASDGVAEEPAFDCSGTDRAVVLEAACR
jgi:hypothetical protein